MIVARPCRNPLSSTTSLASASSSNTAILREPTTTSLRLLLWIKPAHVNVGQLVARIFEGGENHVGDVAVDDRFWPRHWTDSGAPPSKPIGDADVVRGKRPPGVFIGTNDAEVEALVIQIAHLPQFAAFDHAADMANDGMIFEQMPDHEHAVQRSGPVRSTRRRRAW